MRRVACKSALTLLLAVLASCGGGGGEGPTGSPMGQAPLSHSSNSLAGDRISTAKTETEDSAQVQGVLSVQADSSGLIGEMNDPAALAVRAGVNFPITITLDGEIKTFTMLGSSYLGGTIGEAIARLDREPYGPIYPVVFGSQEPLDILWHATGAVRYPDGRYAVFLSQKRQMPPGIYNGVVQLKLCKDPLCAAEYRVIGGEIPYEVEYLPEAVLTVKLNGVAKNVVYGRPQTFLAADGATVEIESSVPVNWVMRSMSTTRKLEITEKTDRRIVGTMTPEDWASGWIDVVPEPLDARHTQNPGLMIVGPRYPFPRD